MNMTMNINYFNYENNMVIYIMHNTYYNKYNNKFY